MSKVKLDRYRRALRRKRSETDDEYWTRFLALRDEIDVYLEENYPHAVERARVNIREAVAEAREEGAVGINMTREQRLRWEACALAMECGLDSVEEPQGLDSAQRVVWSFAVETFRERGSTGLDVWDLTIEREVLARLSVAGFNEAESEAIYAHLLEQTPALRPMEYYRTALVSGEDV